MNGPPTAHGYADGVLAATEEGRRRATGFVGSGLRDGSPAPAVAEVFDGLERIADAHRPVGSTARLGKIVVRVRHRGVSAQRLGTPSGLPSRSSGGRRRSGVDW
ncbi:MDR/zinc-dependent alcohol dehydrogenase-like family protein [Streptomyces bikiniensis]|uniref:hypothetical protein n=1 Tax=Streptomyces bikiniensis TaxID=1896 RepID=UPI0004C214C6|nr:hypothetical protein [Streptomyces bikiniensis]